MPLKRGKKMNDSNIIIAIATVVTTVVSIYGLFRYKFEKIDQRFDKVFEEFKEVRKEINGLDKRLSNIEGQIIQITRPQYYINPTHLPEEPKEN